MWPKTFGATPVNAFSSTSRQRSNAVPYSWQTGVAILEEDYWLAIFSTLSVIHRSSGYTTQSHQYSAIVEFSAEFQLERGSMELPDLVLKIVEN